MSKNYVIGIDVGTGSARAGIFDRKGTMVASHSEQIQMWKPTTDFVQQSSGDIWKACCSAVKQAIAKAEIDPAHVQGIGFDATCSLVLLGEGDRPITVSPEGQEEQNIIVWMDHRAKREAEQINRTGHEVLDYVGGKISPEMQAPKLLWLKQHMPGTWGKARKFFDLADFLVYRSTGMDVRSVCTTTCKWTYMAHEKSEAEGSIGQWDDSFFKTIGLEDIPDNNYQKIGRSIRPVGESVGSGLTDEAARQLGLAPGTAVGVGIIDAHAGGLGLLGMSLEENEDIKLENNIALIGGTSSCHMAVSDDPIFVDGVWGPYYSAMIPGMWLTEGGQSATGALIDHIIFSSDQSEKLRDKAQEKGASVYELLNQRLYKLAKRRKLQDVSMLTNRLHLLPYFHGNRSPRANPSLRGGISGLTLSDTLDGLALQYLAGIQGVAYGTRHIIETMNQSGYSITNIVATGGGTKNDLFLKEHADICGCPITLPEEPEAVLLGSAVLGAVAAGTYPSVLEAMQQMNSVGRVITPNGSKVKAYHDAKYKVFHKMYEDQLSYAEIMNKAKEQVMTSQERN
ncbi:MAG TPA: FGGY-family carbohydrate kinase [Fodinibius sp.]|nr:FGGY-family carbohydrate kinase [Fodinibius sp.]